MAVPAMLERRRTHLECELHFSGSRLQHTVGYTFWRGYREVVVLVHNHFLSSAP